MQLVKPEKKYLQSYYEACVETWDNIHDSYIIHNPLEYEDWWHSIFEDYIKQERGENLPEGFVPSVTYWIVSGEEYIGTVNIRPVLNDRLKEYGGHIGIVIRTSCRKQGYGKLAGKMAMEKAYQMGVKELLLTCEETNTGSQKILEQYNPKKVEKAIVQLNGKKTGIKR